MAAQQPAEEQIEKRIAALAALQKRTLLLQKKHLYIRSLSLLAVVAGLVYMLSSLYLQATLFDRTRFQMALSQQIEPFIPELLSAGQAAFEENREEITAQMDYVFQKRRPDMRAALYREMDVFSTEFPQAFVQQVPSILHTNMQQHLHEFSQRYPEILGAPDNEELAGDILAGIYEEAGRLTEKDVETIGLNIHEVVAILHDEKVAAQIELLSHIPSVNDLFVGAFLDMMSEGFPPPDLKRLLQETP